MVRPANKIAEPDKSDKKSPTDPSKSDVKIKQPYAMCQHGNGIELISVGNNIKLWDYYVMLNNFWSEQIRSRIKSSPIIQMDFIVKLFVLFVLVGPFSVPSRDCRNVNVWGTMNELVINRWIQGYNELTAEFWGIMNKRVNSGVQWINGWIQGYNELTGEFRGTMN